MDTFYVVNCIVHSRSNPSDYEEYVYFSFWACDRFSVWGLVSVLVWRRSQSWP